MGKKSITERVYKAATALLDKDGSVNFIDVLIRLTWLDNKSLESWKTGRIDSLLTAVKCSKVNFYKGVKAFAEWSGKYSFITADWKYKCPHKGEITLRVTGDSVNSLLLRHFLKPGISSRKKVNLEVKLNDCPPLKLYLTAKVSKCGKCKKRIPEDQPCWIENESSVCLNCLGKSELVFLRSGNAALSRRAAKYAKDPAEVVQYNNKRKRYERRGILIDSTALKKAEAECDADAGKRAEARVKNAEKLKVKDIDFTSEFSEKVKELFPSCPEGEVSAIAEHATERGSGRVGRTAAAKNLDNESVRLAVIAYIRHKHTDYERYLLNRTRKAVARKLIQPALKKKLQSWESD